MTTIDQMGQPAFNNHRISHMLDSGIQVYVQELHVYTHIIIYNLWEAIGACVVSVGMGT